MDADLAQKVFGIFQNEFACSRSRLFKLVEGTSKDDNNRAVYRGIHDLDGNGRDEAHHLVKLVDNAFRRRGSTLLLQSVQTFDFHRRLSASEYRSPVAPSTISSKSACGHSNSDGSKDRL